MHHNLKGQQCVKYIIQIFSKITIVISFFFSHLLLKICFYLPLLSTLPFDEINGKNIQTYNIIQINPFKYILFILHQIKEK